MGVSPAQSSAHEAACGLANILTSTAAGSDWGPNDAESIFANVGKHTPNLADLLRPWSSPGIDRGQEAFEKVGKPGALRGGDGQHFLMIERRAREAGGAIRDERHRGALQAGVVGRLDFPRRGHAD